MTAIKRRPAQSKKTPLRVNNLLEFLCNGGTISGWCRTIDAVRLSSVYKWLDEDEELGRQVARARRVGCDVIEQEMIEIADNPTIIDAVSLAGKPIKIVHPDDVGDRKLKLWMREKRLAWNDGDRYGAKVQIDKTVTHKLRELLPEERTRRIAELQEKARVKGPQITVVETKELSDGK